MLPHFLKPAPRDDHSVKFSIAVFRNQALVVLGTVKMCNNLHFPRCETQSVFFKTWIETSLQFCFGEVEKREGNVINILTNKYIIHLEIWEYPQEIC